MIKGKYLIVAGVIFIVGATGSFGSVRDVFFTQYDLLTSEREGKINVTRIIAGGNWILDKNSEQGLSFRLAGLVEHQDELVTFFPKPEEKDLCKGLGQPLTIGGYKSTVCQLTNPNSSDFNLLQFDDFDLVLYFQKMETVEMLLVNTRISTEL